MGYLPQYPAAPGGGRAARSGPTPMGGFRHRSIALFSLFAL